MLRFVDDTSSLRLPRTRREFLRIGSLLPIASLLAGQRSTHASDEAPRRPGFGRAKSVILLFTAGGQSQIDMWDPKPNAPDHIRGQFAPISTSVTGTAFTEHMPRVAKVADKFTVVRSLSHEDLDHGTATYLALTGRYHRIRSGNPPISPADYPTLGAIFKNVTTDQNALVPATHINGPLLIPEQIGPGQNGGFLGKGFGPFVVGDVTQSQIAVPGLDPMPELPTVRMDARRGLKASLDQFSHALDRTPATREMNVLFRRAYEMLDRPGVRDAFDLSAEPGELRARYGLDRSGQSCLLARRLVEAGVPLVTVFWNHCNRGQDRAPNTTDLYGWDTHNDIFDAMSQHLLPRFDVSFSALIEDLDRRGLLDDTLVVCMGEFGRAPKIAFEKNFAGNSPGRKHWASVYSGVFAGAGVSEGNVLGASDRFGGEPTTERFGPWDVSATIFAALGIDPASHFHDVHNRPFIITEGKPITPLYG